MTAADDAWPLSKAKVFLHAANSFTEHSLPSQTPFQKSKRDASSILNALPSIVSGLKRLFSFVENHGKLLMRSDRLSCVSKFLVKYVMLCFVWAECGLLFWKPAVTDLPCFETSSVLRAVICAPFTQNTLKGIDLIVTGFNYGENICLTHHFWPALYCFPPMLHSKAITASIQTKKKTFEPLCNKETWIRRICGLHCFSLIYDSATWEPLLTLHALSLTCEGVLSIMYVFPLEPRMWKRVILLLLFFFFPPLNCRLIYTRLFLLSFSHLDEGGGTQWARFTHKTNRLLCSHETIFNL